LKVFDLCTYVCLSVIDIRKNSLVEKVNTFSHTYTDSKVNKTPRMQLLNASDYHMVIDTCLLAVSSMQLSTMNKEPESEDDK
jgi:hypothetical protein